MPVLNMPATVPATPAKHNKPVVKRKRRLWLYALGFILLAAVAALAYRSTVKPEAPSWTAVPVQTGAVIKSISATGKVDALTTVNVGSQVSGTVAELFVDFNTPVKKGQIIARLDSSQLEAQLTQASANQLSATAAIQTGENAVLGADASAQAAEFNVERTKSVVADAQRNLKLTQDMADAGVIARRELDTAKAALAQATAQQQQAVAQWNQAKAQTQTARSQVNQARAQAQQAAAAVQLANVNLQHTIIKAPIDGVVVARNVDVGQTVAASLQAPTLFLIAQDLSKMQVLADIDEADIGQLGAESRVTFTVDAYPADTFDGRIAQIRLAPQTVQNVVTYTAVIQVNNPELKLKPGMTANVTAIVAEKQNVVTVPNAALRFKREATGRPTVWKIEGETLTPAPVKLGITDGVVSEVVSGDVQAGDRVATPPTPAVSGGQRAGGAARNPMMPMGGGGRGTRR
ncbi:MAG TPA: efflux RND transporter periplasmic adaptor subunit [Bryobacteraceae bacterium]|nr:efflux RND transporter periplasmic adaptor subunit [Bryobacteraceae bacterium]